MSQEQSTVVNNNTAEKEQNKPAGKPKKLMTDYFQQTTQPTIDQRVKKLCRAIQVELEYELSNDNPNERFWCLLAEQKRMELEHALSENARLYHLKDTLTQQNKYYKEMLDEANNFITVFKEVVEEANDTGIDPGDTTESSDDRENV